MSTLNFKHLHYFWMAARSGGIVKAGERLHTTPQTLSGQIKLLEQRLGRRLFRRRGRELELTEDGRVALGYADEIFALGAELEEQLGLGERATGRSLEFQVGVVDVVPKTLAYHLIEPALDLDQPVRLTVHEGKLPDLLAQMAVHRLDLVIADAPLPKSASVRAFNHLLGRTPVTFFAAPALAATLRGPFPRCLDGAPMLLQGSGSAIRPLLSAWLARQGLRPRMVAEFDDGALLKAFGRQGRGIFVAPSVLADEIVELEGVRVVGRTGELLEEFYALSLQRRLTHPCVVAITSAARTELFGA